MDRYVGHRMNVWRTRWFTITVGDSPGPWVLDAGPVHLYVAWLDPATRTLRRDNQSLLRR